MRPKFKLMVVDDDRDNLDLLYQTFIKEFQVYRADSGIEALKILEKEGEMAFIISDQQMPEMKGTEFLEKTVEQFPDTIRILLILTEYTDVEDLVDAINASKVFKCIVKPWTPTDLNAVVAQAAETYKVIKKKTAMGATVECDMSLESGPKRPKLKLMVVDDDRDNLDLLYRTFRKKFQVYRANSGIKGLEILEKQGEMAIVISDQQMPEMKGTEFLEKTEEVFPDTIRILLTEYIDLEDLVDAINASKVFKYIVKPWTPTDLKAVVEQAVKTYVINKRTVYCCGLPARRKTYA